ncbi:MAG: ABC transporter substrate-binding protein [Chthoniobacterales bacterium]
MLRSRIAAAGFTCALAASLLLAGCKPAADRVRLGLNLELTGDIQAVGASSKNAAELFRDQINTAGGLKLGETSLPLEMIIRDNAANPMQSASVAQGLIVKDGVVAMIGPNSTACALPAAGIAESLKCVMISPWSTDVRTTMDEASGVPKRYVFRSCFTDPFQARVIARFARGQLEATRAAVLFEADTEVTRSQAELFRDTFAADGGEVVAFQSYRPGQDDYSAELAALRESAPDVIYIPAYYTDVPKIARQVRAAGLTVPLLGSDAWVGPDLLRLGGTDLDGSYICRHFSPDSANPKAREFVAAYTAKYGTPPDDVAALTYDACGLIAAALEQAGKNDREALREALAKIPAYQGVTGTFRFEPGSGDPLKSAAILQIEEGAIVWVKDAAP